MCGWIKGFERVWHAKIREARRGRIMLSVVLRFIWHAKAQRTQRKQRKNYIKCGAKVYMARKGAKDAKEEIG